MKKGFKFHITRINEEHFMFSLQPKKNDQQGSIFSTYTNNLKKT